jgi:hypothetical protein
MLLIEKPQTTEKLRGEPLLGEKTFAESGASWKRRSVERSSEERIALWRDSSRSTELRGDTLRGERSFMEVSSRRPNLWGGSFNYQVIYALTHLARSGHRD